MIWQGGQITLAAAWVEIPKLKPADKRVDFDTSLVLVNSEGLFFPANFRAHAPHAVGAEWAARKFEDVVLAATYGAFWKRYLPAEVAIHIRKIPRSQEAR